jgi:hypothetical protein
MMQIYEEAKVSVEKGRNNRGGKKEKNEKLSRKLDILERINKCKPYIDP